MRKRQYSIGEVARRLGVSVEQVRKLADNGAIKATRTEGGHRRFTEAAIAEYEAKQEAAEKRRSLKRNAPPRPRTPSARRKPSRAERPDRLEVLDTILSDEEDEWEDEWDDEWFEPEEVPERYRQPIPPPPAPTPRKQVPITLPPIERQQLRPPSGLAQVDEVRAHEREAEQKAQEEARRIQRLKDYGLDCIPYGTPPEWRARVVQALEERVTSKGVPPWLSFSEQRNMVRAIVEEVLKPYREEVAREEQARRRVDELIKHGIEYAEEETGDWDYFDKYRARREVEEALRAEVKPDWDEEDVEDLVDEVLDEGEDDQDEI